MKLIILNSQFSILNSFFSFSLPKCQRTLVRFQYIVIEICLRNTSIKWDGKNIVFIIRKIGQIVFWWVLL